MKKLTLSIGLLAGILTSNAQDTTCTYFKGKRVLEFNYHTNEVLYEVKQENKFYEIRIQYGDILCLHLSDDKERFRKIKFTFFDGEQVVETLDSKDSVYYTTLGVIKVEVGTPRIKLFTN
tara:strand:- start:320 stop:679 length:360 start_codon:yes stop_codon:yes gene_type:complete